jgi:hypothetical protein
MYPLYVRVAWETYIYYLVLICSYVSPCILCSIDIILKLIMES